MAPIGISVTTSMVSRSLGKIPKVSRSFMDVSARLDRGKQDSLRLYDHQEMRTCRMVAPVAGCDRAGTAPWYDPWGPGRTATPDVPTGMCRRSKEVSMPDP